MMRSKSPSPGSRNRMLTGSRTYLAWAVAAFLLASSGARSVRADDNRGPAIGGGFDAENSPEVHDFRSAERVIVEFRGGPYKPEFNGFPAFNSVYNGDSGPLLGLELEAILYRLPDLLYLTAGGGIGWAHYSGQALDPDGNKVSEETTFTSVPLQALGAVRFDGLARKAHLPLIITGKLGWEWNHWTTGTGKRTDASGWALGLMYGAQLALDLDSLEPRAAREMDEEWGINHTFLFFELYRFAPTSKSLPIGDTTFALGLGFVF